IAKLVPAETSKTVWGNYATANSYSEDETAAKRRFITEFIENTHSRLVWDLGCNTGDYSATALAAALILVVVALGAGFFVGLKFGVRYQIDTECCQLPLSRSLFVNAKEKLGLVTFYSQMHQDKWVMRMRFWKAAHRDMLLA